MKNLTLTLLLIAGTSSLAAAEPDFESIFDGKSLEGWVGDTKLWSVQDGAITGVTTDEDPLPHNKFLIWDNEVENFELRVKARVFGANNSGIQYRSKLLQDVGEFVVAGYQCDIHPQYTGLLIHEKGRLILAMNGQEVIIDNDDKKWLTGMNPAPAIKLDEWNTFEVIAIGNKLVHKVNGEVYTVAIDHNEEGRDLKGVLAFQIHKGPAMRVQFKDIELKRLPSGGVLSLADAPIPENAKEAPGRQQAGRGQARRNAARPVATASTPAQGGSGFIGKWEAEIQTQSGTQKWTFTFLQENGALTGTALTHLAGGDPKIEDLKVEGANISFKQAIKVQGKDFDLKYRGVLKGDVIEFTRAQPRRDKPFTATRARGSFDGVWVSEFNSPNGPRIWTFTFKVDKETLTGGVGMTNGSTAPLYSGKVEGNNITFKQPMPGRQEFELEYSGILNEGVIEFKRVTPNGTQQFTAKRSGSSVNKPSAQTGGNTNRTPTRSKTQRRNTVAGPAINENRATPANRIKAAEGFAVELLHTVPGDTQGSWINLCFDGKGRLIASDQYGGLYRMLTPAAGQALNPADIERIDVDIKAVNGMVWAFDSLYVGVNDYEDNSKSGLYRITDSDGDDRLDKVEHLRQINARGDHGVHAVVLAPDGQSIYLITGNATETTKFDSSRVPTNWGEDHLLPRMPDGLGHMRDVLAPGGIIYNISPNGQEFEVYSIGYRNIFDAAFNADGELFTYDADMERDFNMPWYRPTRVLHVVSGSDFGWRNGTGKRMAWYPDNLGPTINIGAGSPTGVTFGYGAKFPARYQKALYLLDWSWGKLYAIHLTPDGSSYIGEKEDFLTGAPLPLTDAVVNPADGAMYFAIGGRRVQSGLYRVTYVGAESTTPVNAKTDGQKARDVRQRLEAFHGKENPKALDMAWGRLAVEDRFVRWAARVAVESQPVKAWTQRALSETQPERRVEALMALARSAGIDPTHRVASDPPPDKVLGNQITNALLATDWNSLSDEQKLTLVRTYQITFNRFGKPGNALSKRVIAQLDAHFPSNSREMNQLLCESLVYLQSPTAARKGMALILRALTQEEQIAYALSLRRLTEGWTRELRTAYIEWFLKAANFRGGGSIQPYITNIRRDALASMNATETAELAEILAMQPEVKSPLETITAAMEGRSFVKAWTLDDLASDAEVGMTGRDFDNGRTMFAATGCFACHRFNNEGGMTGPDLTAAGGRYSPTDFLDQIINPSKEINEQFVPVVLTKTNGEAITGVIVNLKGDKVTINTDLADPDQRIDVDRKEVESIETSPISPMPPALLNMLTEEEILDLTAYVLSSGDKKNAMFD